MDYIILLFHGSRYPTAAPEADLICTGLKNALSSDRVEVAWLQHSFPSLPQALEKIKGTGAVSIRVFPLFSLTGRHVEFDVPLLVEDFKEKNPELKVFLEPHLGADPSFCSWLISRVRAPAELSPTPTTKE